LTAGALTFGRRVRILLVATPVLRAESQKRNRRRQQPQQPGFPINQLQHLLVQRDRQMEAVTSIDRRRPDETQRIASEVPKISVQHDLL
jgi:hypothetical protein